MKLAVSGLGNNITMETWTPTRKQKWTNPEIWLDLGFKRRYLSKAAVLIVESVTTPLQWGVDMKMIYNGVNKMF